MDRSSTTKAFVRAAAAASVAFVLTSPEPGAAQPFGGFVQIGSVPQTSAPRA